MSNNKDIKMCDLSSAIPIHTAVLDGEQRAALVDSLKSKLERMAAGKNQPPILKRRVDVLKQIQGEHDILEEKFREEREALEAKYRKLYEPLYNKRYEIVNGVVEVEGNTEEDVKSAEVKGVPGFWCTALKSNEVLTDEITDRDEGALMYLKDIKWCKISEPKGFKLEFIFDTNPYFRNTVLTKTYHMIDEEDPILEKAIGTEIEWYPGKCLTQKLLKKKPKKGSKNVKPVLKTEDCPSFFCFFSPPEVPENDDDLDEEAAEDLQTQMEQDYDIGSTIRDKIIPHAVSWFTGDAVEDEDYDIEEDDEDDADDEDDDEDGDDDDDEDEDEDEDEEDDKLVSGKKKSGKARGGDGQLGERPPECKQQ